MRPRVASRPRGSRCVRASRRRVVAQSCVVRRVASSRRRVSPRRSESARGLVEQPRAHSEGGGGGGVEPRRGWVCCGLFGRGCERARARRVAQPARDGRAACGRASPSGAPPAPRQPPRRGVSGFAGMSTTRTANAVDGAANHYDDGDKPSCARRSVMHYTVLYCTALYRTVLYCTVLYCTVLCCTILYCTVLYCAVTERSATISSSSRDRFMWRTAM